jgi:hypothetical protein
VYFRAARGQALLGLTGPGPVDGAVLYRSAMRSYVAALAWVAVGCALYAWQILSLAVR